MPLDALGQENAWAPSKDRGNLGWVAYYMRWLVYALAGSDVGLGHYGRGGGGGVDGGDWAQGIGRRACVRAPAT